MALKTSERMERRRDRSDKGSRGEEEEKGNKRQIRCDVNGERERDLTEIG